MTKKMMKGLNDRLYPLKNNTEKNHSDFSKLHQKAVKVVKKRYPTAVIWQDTSAKLNHFKTLYLDIYLPTFGIIIEVNGEQHFTQSKFFHSSKEKFLIQKRNDREKKEWAELNGLTLIDFNHDESEDEWAAKLG